MSDDALTAPPTPADEPASKAAGVAAPTADGAASDAPPKRKGRGSFARELPFLVLVAFVLALVIKAFFVQAFFIPSGSMERTLLVNDRVLVNKLVYHFRDVHRGEIVVFSGKHTNFPPESPTLAPGNAVQRAVRSVQGALGLGAPSDKDFIKRVIGLPGDQISCCKDGRVVVRGQALNEPYLFQDNQLPFCDAGPGNTEPKSGVNCRSDSPPFTVPPGMVFVMGDHRGDSQDSRFNGPIPISSIVGRAFVRVWPVNRFGLLRVPTIFTRASSALGADPALALGVLGAVPLTVLRRRVRGRKARRAHASH